MVEKVRCPPVFFISVDELVFQLCMIVAKLRWEDCIVAKCLERFLEGLAIGLLPAPSVPEFHPRT